MGVEKQRQAEFEKLREHHIVTKYSPSLFPRETNVLNRLRELGRFAPSQDLLHMDEGVFFDRSNIHLLPTFKEHLLASIASLIRSSETPIYIAKSIVRDCVDIPVNEFVNDLTKYFGEVGVTPDSLVDVNNVKARELLKSCYVPNTPEHEVEHLEMAETLKCKQPYMLYNVQFVYTGDKKVIIASSGGVAHSSPATVVDSVNISMAPKLPSAGDFGKVRKEILRLREQGRQGELSEIEDILRNKLRVYGYAKSPKGNGVNLRMQTIDSVRPLRIAERIGIPSIDDNIQPYDSCIDIRDFEEITGNEYGAKCFSDKFGVAIDRVASLKRVYY